MRSSPRASIYLQQLKDFPGKDRSVFLSAVLPRPAVKYKREAEDWPRFTR